MGILTARSNSITEVERRVLLDVPWRTGAGVYRGVPGPGWGRGVRPTRSIVASAVFAAAAPRSDPRLLLLVEPLLYKPLLGDLLACGCGGLVVLGELRVAHLSY